MFPRSTKFRVGRLFSDVSIGHLLQLSNTTINYISRDENALYPNRMRISYPCSDTSGDQFDEWLQFKGILVKCLDLIVRKRDIVLSFAENILERHLFGLRACKTFSR